MVALPCTLHSTARHKCTKAPLRRSAQPAGPGTNAVHHGGVCRQLGARMSPVPPPPPPLPPPFNRTAIRWC